MLTQKRKCNCMSCGEKLSEDIVIIGEQYPSAVFATKDSEIEKKIPSTSLNLARCTNEKCNLVQLSNYYDLQYVFDHYPYESNTTATMKDILMNVVNDAQKFIKLSKDDVVLDIGGNDGTLLSFIDDKVLAKVNIDAAAGVNQKLTDENYHYIHSKFNSSVYNSLDLPKPKLIFSIAMFYHLSDPVSFCRNVYDIMDDDSVWVLQMTYLGTMLEDNIFDNIVHEHAAYYSLMSLEYLLNQVGLHVAEARLAKSYGGSIRVFIVKDKEKYSKVFDKKDYQNIQQYELEHKTNTFEALYAFNSRIQLLKNSLSSLIDHLINENGPMWGFGASTKGNMILQLLGIKSDKLSYILDNNSKKIGTRTLGSDIEIISEQKNIKNVPSHLLVLPYYYVKAFVHIIKKNLPKGRSTTLVVPLPHPYFIKVEGECDGQ